VLKNSAFTLQQAQGEWIMYCNHWSWSVRAELAEARTSVFQQPAIAGSTVSGMTV